MPNCQACVAKSFELALKLRKVKKLLNRTAHIQAEEMALGRGRHEKGVPIPEYLAGFQVVSLDRLSEELQSNCGLDMGVVDRKLQALDEAIKNGGWLVGVHIIEGIERSMGLIEEEKEE